MRQFFEFSAEVEQALHEKKPVLALESTVITHGLPYPQNQEVAHKLQKIARDHGVTPATIAIMNGKIKLGLSDNEIEKLVHDKTTVKASTRDIPYILSKKLNAGTTVAATLYCADYAGIRVFATGGIGGVHRGGMQDVSADLIQLARTPIAVVCAGMKAILDLPATLEFLETHCIPVSGYKTDVLPAFYSATSHYKVPMRFDALDELTNYLQIHWQMGLPSGVLIANPISAHAEIPFHEIEPVIQLAVEKANSAQIQGSAITPYLLSEVAKATEGKSLQANIQLIQNNVHLGAQLAKAIC